GIRDFHVAGVQTCALPISVGSIYFGSEPDSVFGDSVKSISLSNIPALATVWLTPWEGDDVVYMPELSSGFPSLGMWAWPGTSLRSEERRVGEGCGDGRDAA